MQLFLCFRREVYRIGPLSDTQTHTRARILASSTPRPIFKKRSYKPTARTLMAAANVPSASSRRHQRDGTCPAEPRKVQAVARRPAASHKSRDISHLPRGYQRTDPLPRTTPDPSEEDGIALHQIANTSQTRAAQELRELDALNPLAYVIVLDTHRHAARLL